MIWLELRDNRLETILSVGEMKERQIKIGISVDVLVSTPFDLERGPLVRALLVRLAALDHVLELVFDHAICDGWSHAVILDDLAKLYEGFRDGKDPGLAAPRVQYDDHG